jgi:hypothetical protein
MDGIECLSQPQLFDMSKADKVFGLKCGTMMEVAKDMIIDDFKARGWQDRK